MEIVAIPSPGSPDGPCRGSCGHPECLKMRARAGLRCADCGQLLGFGNRVVIDPPEHLKCRDGANNRRQAESAPPPAAPKRG